MRTVYLDTSALGRVVLGEPDAPVVLAALAPFERRVASRLMRAELLRLASRGDVIASANALLGGVALLPLDEPVLLAAEALDPTALGTLDAIHLATALRLAEAGALDSLMTFDRRLARAAAAHGLRVLSPA